jgi:hypothetical protein
MDIGIGWEFYHHQLGQRVAASLCDVHVTKKMERSSIASVISVLEKALTETKAMEGDLRDFPVQDVVYDIMACSGNEVEVNLNIQHYGMKSFGEGCFEPTFLFSRYENNKWTTFTYGLDGDLDKLTTFLLE